MSAKTIPTLNHQFNSSNNLSFSVAQQQQNIEQKNQQNSRKRARPHNQLFLSPPHLKRRRLLSPMPSKKLDYQGMNSVPFAASRDALQSNAIFASQQHTDMLNPMMHTGLNAQSQNNVNQINNIAGAGTPRIPLNVLSARNHLSPLTQNQQYTAPSAGFAVPHKANHHIPQQHPFHMHHDSSLNLNSSFASMHTEFGAGKKKDHFLSVPTTSSGQPLGLERRLSLFSPHRVPGGAPQQTAASKRLTPLAHHRNNTIEIDEDDKENAYQKALRQTLGFVCEKRRSAIPGGASGSSPMVAVHSATPPSVQNKLSIYASGERNRGDLLQHPHRDNNAPFSPIRAMGSLLQESAKKSHHKRHSPKTGKRKVRDYDAMESSFGSSKRAQPARKLTRML